ncbi:D-glycero-alpha-D-manno-heptose-1,7-bisphosphate 7-phosphatase [Nitrospira moscoviensis]|uniref:D,D-heptose 1,7-bisphosphate phosphatase n=1 Tax=Nitrospira moscoviensis TaxID=42253 RepID=A0A0K2GCT2_NITMO|nr:HAD family hydrolase [Nitrospira moscoviensis]ALA58758.1 D,D-heptose 1,7-bisphosphate phosphatase [Nitrospira moscoviensis]
MPVNTDKRPAVFLDKDGTLIENVPVVGDTVTVHVLPGVVDGLRLLHQAGYLLVVVTNQGGVAQGLFTEEYVKHMEQGLRLALSARQIPLAGFYYCPHHPEGIVPSYAVQCLCRKPKPGLLLRAASDLGIDLDRSWMIGDILHDVEAGRWAGCRTVLLDHGNETEWEMNETRWPDYLADGMVHAAALIVNAPSSASSRLSTSQEADDD